MESTESTGGSTAIESSEMVVWVPPPAAVPPEPQELNALADEINAKHFDLVEMHAASSARVLHRAQEIGARLRLVKSMLRRGEWRTWVETNCRFTLRMAQNYMKIDENWAVVEAKRVSFSALSLRAALEFLHGGPPEPTSLGVEDGPSRRRADRHDLHAGGTDATEPAGRSAEEAVDGDGEAVHEVFVVRMTPELGKALKLFRDIHGELASNETFLAEAVDAWLSLQRRLRHIESGTEPA